MNNYQDIWQLALQILGRRSHSEYELREKLHHKSYTIDEIDDVICRLLAYGYVNDAKLATILFEKYLLIGKYSFKNIIYKLKQRGLPDSIMQNVANNYNNEEELRSALKIVNNRFKSLETINNEKVYRFLATRGFGTTTIHKVLEHLNHDESE